MTYQDRQPIYRKLEEARDSKILAIVTSDRIGEYYPGKGVGTIIADDCVPYVVALLDKIKPTKKISLLLHTNGGHTLVAWRLVNLIRTFADDFEVLIPQKALSAGTMLAIGADRIVMTKQAVLGPIDPSVNNPLNPVPPGTQQRTPVSVENVRAYLSAAQDQLGIRAQQHLTSIFLNLSTQLHPLVIGEAYRSRSQIRFLARKLLKPQLPTPDRSKFAKMFGLSENEKRTEAIIDFLCADFGSHDYTINRREARALGLVVETPSAAIYDDLWNIFLSYADELKLTQPYSAETVLGQNATAPLSEPRGLIESTEGGSVAFLTKGTLTRLPQQPGAYNTTLQFEAWKKMH